MFELVWCCLDVFEIRFVWHTYQTAWHIYLTSIEHLSTAIEDRSHLFRAAILPHSTYRTLFRAAILPHGTYPTLFRCARLLVAILSQCNFSASPFLHETRPMKLHVALTSGRTFTIGYVVPTDYIWYVKWLLEEDEGIPLPQQRILFEGKELDNSKSLQHYNITEEKTLTLVLDRKRKHEDISDSEDSC